MRSTYLRIREKQQVQHLEDAAIELIECILSGGDCQAMFNGYWISYVGDFGVPIPPSMRQDAPVEEKWRAARSVSPSAHLAL
ncbi:hypothetical protein NMY22_g17543 [Coprinellus aureogranulatus]|nr:hypothetical protein NMY22_g17543 [Coprinellus aureogranulatus]